MEYEVLADQLRCPSGTDALDVAEEMNLSNGLTNQRCFDKLRMEDHDHFLEIGPGNGVFVQDLLKKARNISYIGLDWSADMVAAASKHNAQLMTESQVAFLQGNASILPFDTNAFDKVMTVHTLYFWENPAAQLAEIRRVLKPNGRFCLAFGDREFMQRLPFTSYGFTLYDRPNVEALLQSAGLQILDAELHQEWTKSIFDEVIEKKIHILICQPQ